MKKQLLNERQIRKMMKIANITPLANGFIDRLTENEMFEQTLGEADDPLADLGAPADTSGGEDPMADLGVGDEEETVTADEEPEDEDALCSAMTALKALKLGLEKLDPEAASKIQIETEEEDDEDMEGDEDAGLAGLGTGDEGGDLAGVGGEGEEDDEGGGLGGLAEANIFLREHRGPSVTVPPLQRRRPTRFGQRRIISEVTRRVASRLMRLQRQDKRRS